MIQIYGPVPLLHSYLWHLAIPATGISYDGTAFTVTYDPSATAEQITQGNQIASTWSTTPQQTRQQTDIYNDIRNLTALQKQHIQSDLYCGTPMKALLDTGFNGPTISALLTVRQCGFASQAADRTIIDNNVFSLYTQDNVYYLTHPSFDTSINVSALVPVSKRALS